MSPHGLPVAVALLAAAFAGPAAAQDLKGGSYACTSNGKQFGTIEIDANRYRAAGGGWSGYRRVGQAILWNGALGPISEAGEVVGTTVTGKGFDIQIKTAGGGTFQLVRCRA